MSRDPLEGYRPSDTSGPSFAPAPPVSFESPVAPRPVSPGSPKRGSSAKAIVLVVVVSMFAVVAGVAGYFLSLPHAPLAPKAKPTSEMIVKQGAPPADDPSPTPIETPK